MKIGIIGGGQLARMLALSGYPLGHEFVVLDRDEHCCASKVAPFIRGSYDDNQSLSELAAQSDVITFEFENVPAESLKFLTQQSVTVHPHFSVLEITQDRLTEKELFVSLGIPTPRFTNITTSNYGKVLREFSGASIIKTRRLGYDGKGQVRVTDASKKGEAQSLIAQVPCIAEEIVNFERELSIVGVRGEKGSFSTYPLVENFHQDGILRMTIAPASGIRDEMQSTASEYLKRIMDKFSYTGIGALELFESNGRLVANEFAPRVHNSGHWSQDGAVTSQFENHIRAITGLALGATTVRQPTIMVNFIGGVPPIEHIDHLLDGKIHLYGKQGRPGRKVGHMNFLKRERLTAEEIEIIKTLVGMPLSTMVEKIV